MSESSMLWMYDSGAGESAAIFFSSSAMTEASKAAGETGKQRLTTEQFDEVAIQGRSGSVQRLAEPVSVA